MRRALLLFSLAVLVWGLVTIARPAASAPDPVAAADRSWEEQVFRMAEARKAVGARFIDAVERAKAAAVRMKTEAEEALRDRDAAGP